MRNGGIIAFVTSSGTMDKKDNSVRKYISARTDFLGAIRLPNTTFKGVAGTEVTSDIIFLKKKDSVLEHDEDWIHLAEDENGLTYNKYFVENPRVAGTEVTSDIIFLKKKDSVLEHDEDWIHLAEDENGLTYNKYFVENPTMVLGNIQEISGRFGNTIACLPKENIDLKDLLTQATEEIWTNAKYEEIELLDDEISCIPATDDVKNFSYTTVDNEVYYRENSLFIKKDVTDDNKQKIKDYIKRKF